MDKVSIILPVYNCEQYLKHSIISVQNQDYKNWELLIVNDGSTDKSLEIAQHYAAKDERIKVIALEQNVGVGAARNVAIAQADGRYMAFIDADDLWAKEKLSRQIVFMRKHNAALSHTASAYMNADGEIMSHGYTKVDEKINMVDYMNTSQIMMSSVMIDRQKIKEVHFPEDRKLCEDARLWMDYLRSGEPFYGLNQVLLAYRKRPNQLSHRKDKMALAAFKRFMNEKTLSPMERISCFMHYAVNATKKWGRKSTIDPQYIKDNFNCR